MHEKSHREDHAIDTRPAPTLAARTDAHPASHGTASAMWLAQDSAREAEVGAEGTRDAARALPYRGELEQALGFDLSHVQAHIGPHATAAADKLGAEAYALRDRQAIVFGDAHPSKDLVAHEVVHTLQHGTGAISQDEAEADAVGGKLAAGERVDRGAITSGGGTVRKRAKSNLAQIFDDFLKGSATVEDELVGHHAADGSFAAVRGSREVALTGSGRTVTETETERAGTADRVQDAIVEARQRVDREKLATHFRNARVLLDKLALEGELRELENLDQTLVARKTDQVRQQLRAADQRAAALDAELAALAHTERVLDTLDAEIAKGDGGVPQALLDAEASFRGTETTRKRTFGFDVLAGKLSRSVEVARAEVSDIGTQTNSRTNGIETALGGGLSHTKTSTSKTSDGAITREVSRSSTTSYKLGEDGAFGLGKSGKLAGAIENSFGKATGGGGLDGGFTTNIVPIPKDGGETLYAIVTTINLGAAVEAGLSTEPEVAKQKIKAAITAKGGISAQLTQTHVLDQAHVKRYLRALDQIAAGGRAPDAPEPELGMLFKAVHAVDHIDELVAGATSAIGSSTAASKLAVDESVELTTKVSGELEGSASIGPLGGSRGTKGELYRSLKIARVEGKPGQELIEVSVTFGESSDVHGALTGSALGVTASIGDKAWSAQQEAATFRFDPSASDYAALYDEVLASKAPADVAELRTSLRFSKHVHGYSTQRTTGHEDSVGISGGIIGMTDAETRQRSTAMGRDQDGELTADVAGQQGRATGFSVGPLELLRRSQVDAARFELRDGVGTLDISERTSASSVGQFDWSLTGLVSAESPAKAAEKALLRTTETLSGFLLDKDDVERLGKIARQDEDVWSKVPAAVDGGLDRERAIAWNTLRTRLAHPKIPNDPQVPIEVARELYLGGAVADFMTSGTGAKTADYIRTLLRDPEAIGGRDAQDVGVAYEFNADVSAASYKDVRQRCKGVEIYLERFVVDRERGIEPAMTYVAELQADLAKLLHAVEESYAFTSERSRVEMISELRGFAAEFPRIERELVRKCNGIDVPEAQLSTDARADEQARITQLELSLEKSKVSERWLLDRIAKRAGQRGEAHDEMGALVTNLREQYEAHRFLVHQLRATYSAACIDGSRWRVSMSKADARKDLDIDAPRFLELYGQYLAGRHGYADAFTRDGEKLLSEVMTETRSY